MRCRRRSTACWSRPPTRWPTWSAVGRTPSCLPPRSTRSPIERCPCWATARTTPAAGRRRAAPPQCLHRCHRRVCHRRRRSSRVPPATGATSRPTRPGTGRRCRAPLGHALHSRRFVLATIASLCLVAFAGGTLSPRAHRRRRRRRLRRAHDLAQRRRVHLDRRAHGPPHVDGGRRGHWAGSDGGLPAGVQPSGCGVDARAGVARRPRRAGRTTTWRCSSPDGTWTTTSSMPSADTSAAAAILGRGPNVTLTVRITAVLADGRRSAATATPVITPATAC